MFERESIENIVESALRRKLKNYNPEPAHMPFHTRLLGKDRMALYSFIHSLSTNFGTAIFEQAAKEIADGVFDKVRLQRKTAGRFSSGEQKAITEIINGLSSGNRSNFCARSMRRTYYKTIKECGYLFE